MNLWLTIDESVGYPTELDRGAWLRGERRRGHFLDHLQAWDLNSVPEIVSIMADKTQDHGMATCGYDDYGG